MDKLKIVATFVLMTLALFSVFATLNLKMAYANYANKQIFITSENQILSEEEEGEVEVEEMEVEEEQPEEYIPEYPEEEEQIEEE